MVKRLAYFLGAPLLGAVLLFTGYSLGWRAAQIKSDFHDISVNHVGDYIKLVDPSAPAVRSLALNLSSFDDAYAYVRDKIRLDTTQQPLPPDRMLRTGATSCLGKAILLCSLYRAMGIPADEVRIVLGELSVDGKNFDHAWLDLEIGDRCLQQDPSGLFAWFKADSFPEKTYTKRFVRREHFCFNDKGFAVVSQANRLRAMEEPGEFDNWSRP